MAYTTANQVSNFLQRALTAYETAELDTIIGAIKIWLDKTLNTTFDQAISTTRYYDGGVRNLSIDPCTAISSVESIDNEGNDNYTYTVGTEIIYEPQNQTVKNEIRKRYSPFPYGVHRIAVTALFSEYDGGVPADIQTLATRLAASVINSGSVAGDVSSGGQVKSESLEGHSISYQDTSSTSSGGLDGIAASDPTVMAILNARKDLLIDNFDRRNYSEYDEDCELV